MSAAVRVTCPATSANLGPGFDALGLALGLRNAFEVAEADEGFAVTGEGPGAEGLPSGPENLVVRAFQAARARMDLPPARGLRVRVRVTVPPSRGLGSSATAAVAGALAAQALADDVVRGDVARVAAGLEGHPDNAVPCALGGLCVSVSGPEGRVVWERVVPEDPPALVVAIPRDLELSTEAMRAALPAEVPFTDAAHTAGRAALLVLALARGRHDLLRAALADRLHEPYRGKHIRGLDAVRAAALEAGAYGVVISGSGPTLLGFAPPEAAEVVGQAMTAAWSSAGIGAEARRLAVDLEGARVEHP